MQHVAFGQHDRRRNIRFALLLIGDEIAEHRQHYIARLVILRDPFTGTVPVINADLLADGADLQRIDHKQDSCGVLDMLAVQPQIVLIDHAFTGHIEEHQRQRRLALILEHKLEDKRLLHLFLLGRGQQIAALKQRFFVQRAELAADLGIQRHAGRVKMPGRRMLQRMDQRGHIDRLPDLGSTDDRNNVARHLAGRYRQLVMAGRAEPSTCQHPVAVSNPGQHMVGVMVVFFRNIRRIQNRFHIIHRIKAEALAVFVQRIIFTQRIVLIVFTAVHRPENYFLRLKLCEAVRAHNIVKKRPRLRLVFLHKAAEKRHLSSSRAFFRSLGVIPAPAHNTVRTCGRR
ncbi:hypothetical protein D3C81_1306600 [compost metagenome]